MFKLFAWFQFQTFIESVKNSPFATALLVFLLVEGVTFLRFGKVPDISLISNVLWALMAYFLSLVYNDRRCESK